MLRRLWSGGRPGPAIDGDETLATAAFSYGLAAFEGILCVAPERRERSCHVFRLREHLERLRGSTRALGWEPRDSLDDMTEAAVRYVRAHGGGSHYLRPMAFSRRDFSAFALHTRWAPTRFVVLGVPFGFARMAERMDRELRACVATSVRAAWPAPLVSAKLAGKYLTLAWARDEARGQGCDEAILLDESGHVAEASAANLFVVKDGALATPTLAHVLPGITRATVLELARELGLRVEERTVTPGELLDADEVFTTNTAHGIVGLREIAGGWRARSREVTAAVRAAYLRALTGRDARHTSWLTRVDFDG